MKYRFLRDQVSKVKIKIELCKTELQLADILTKPLNKSRFEVFIGLIKTRRLIDRN